MKKLGYKLMLSLIMSGFCAYSANARSTDHQDATKMLKSGIERAEGNNIAIPAAVQRLDVHLLEEDSNGKQRVLSKKSDTATGGVIVEIISQIWENGAWVNSYRLITTFTDGSYSIPTAFESYEWVNGAWENDSKTIITIVNGFITNMLMSIWENGVWRQFMQITNEFNGNFLIRTFTKIDNLGTGTLANLSKTEFSYDNNSFLSMEMNYSWTGTDWTPISKSTYINNTQGFPVELVYELISGGMTFLSERTLFTYTASGLIATLISQYYDIATVAWINSSRTTNTYNSASLPTGELYEEWDGAAWVKAWQVLTSYTAGRMMEVLNLIWSGAAWENDGRDTYTWNNDMLVEILTQFWLNGVWENDTRDLLTESPTAVAEGGVIPEEFTLGNYPNPFNPETTISYSTPQAAIVSLIIFDVQGKIIQKLLQNQAVAAGTHQIRWDGRNAAGLAVTSGVYFYRLSAQNFSTTKRCILLR